MTIRNFAFVGVVCGESIIINKLPTRKTCGRQGGALLANVYKYAVLYFYDFCGGKCIISWQKSYGGNTRNYCGSDK